jgi:hypothetical protein
MVEFFTLGEKRTFIETLLVIAGVMTGFNPSAAKTNIFVVFAITALAFIIMISSIKKKIKNKKLTRYQYIGNWTLSSFVGFSFSALVLLVGITAGLTGNQTIIERLTLLGGWICIYAILGILLVYVLGTREP